MSKYAIWNKQDPIITPIGEVLTAEQWIERYPVAGVEGITVLCAAGTINGGFFGLMSQMEQIYTDQGCDFSDCTTDEEKLAKMDEFDAQKEAEAAEAAAAAKANEELNTAALTSISASLEYQNMMSLPEVEEESEAE